MSEQSPHTPPKPTLFLAYHSAATVARHINDNHATLSNGTYAHIVEADNGFIVRIYDEDDEAIGAVCYV